jgi:methylenetetrahydrofolate reductase (NADPH)
LKTKGFFVKVSDILRQSNKTFSFEFFPPKTEPGWGNLFKTIAELKDLKPSWVSVTYGAGGTTRENTHNIVIRIKNEVGLTVVSHLTCVKAGRDEIKKILDKYQDAGIENILALRGDPPADQYWNTPDDGFKYASELVGFIKKNYPGMCIGVAGFPEGHPATPNRLLEMDFLKAKIDAGADYIITQLFFDNRDFYDFRERCELAGIRVPIIPGIMPVLSRDRMAKIAEMAAGARIPARLQRAVMRAENDHLVGKVGVHWATEQVRDLLDNGAKGVHFYTLNTARATLKIYEELGVSSSEGLLN